MTWRVKAGFYFKALLQLLRPTAFLCDIEIQRNESRSHKNNGCQVQNWVQFLMT